MTQYDTNGDRLQEFLADENARIHPSVKEVAKFLVPNPNLSPLLSPLQAYIAHDIAGLALEMIRDVNPSPELTAGLRKLLEAKDCFIRASLNNKES